MSDIIFELRRLSCQVDHDCECKSNDQCIVTLEKAIELSEKNNREYKKHFLALKRVICTSKPDIEEAIKLSKEASDIAFNDSFLMASYSQILAIARSKDEANSTLNIALKIKNDNDIYCLLCKAKALKELKRYKESLKYCDRVLEEKPDCYDALIVKGMSLSGIGNHNRAITNYKIALKAEKNNCSMAYRNIGIAYDKIGEYEQAIEYFKQAISINDQDVDAICYIGQSESNLSEKYGSENAQNKALHYYNKALNINSNHLNSLRNKAIALYRLKQFDISYSEMTLCGRIVVA